MRSLGILSIGLCLLVGVAGQTPAQSPQAEAKAIVDKAIEAHGGEKALASLKAVHVKGKGEISVMGMTSPFTADIYSQFPDHFKIVVNLDVNGMNIEIIQAINGKKSWQSLLGKVEDFPADQEKDVKNSLYAERISTLLPLREKEFKLSPLGEVKVDGKAAVGLRVSREGESDVSLFFDKASNLLVKTEYRGKAPGEAMESTLEKIYSKFKKLPSGAQQPMRTVIHSDGKAFIEMDTSEINVVERHDASIFARPE